MTIKHIHETNSRSLTKSILYRLYNSFLVTPLIAYTLTTNITLSLTFGIVEFIVKIFTYYLYERIFAHIDCGYLWRKNGD